MILLFMAAMPPTACFQGKRAVDLGRAQPEIPDQLGEQQKTSLSSVEQTPKAPGNLPSVADALKQLLPGKGVIASYINSGVLLFKIVI